MSLVRVLVDAPQEDAALGLVLLNRVGDLVPDIRIARPLEFGDPGAEHATLLQQRRVLLAERQKEFFPQNRPYRTRLHSRLSTERT